jgi:hypothetical protein
MPKLTTAAWNAAIDACGGDMSKDDLINLVFKDGPNALWQETINQMHVMNDGMHNYFSGLFPTRVWNDWKGTTELGRVYHSPYIPMDFSIFQRSMQICDPANANECHRDYAEIPRGGLTNLPEMEMYKAGFKTEPMCIANIRTSDQARQIAEMIVKERYAVDEQVMNTFFTMALIRMLGHKYVIEYQDDGAGSIEPVDSLNPYNPLQGFRFSYMQPLFPAAGNLENIMPLDLSFLDMYGGVLSRSRDQSFIARGPRGEPIYELWHPEDWYRQEVIDNPEYVEKTKYHINYSALPGYRMAGGKEQGGMKEIVGNFSMRQNDSLPRFAESTEGGISVVQPFANVAVDSGNRALHNYREYDNAPFYMASIIGNGVGEILTRPAISTGIEGLPIQPITGNGEWLYRNDYDKDCNDDLNMPHFRKGYEMGFKMLNPDAGRGFIFRAKKFRMRPTQTCNLRPIFKIIPSKLSSDITTIGCNPNNNVMGNNIMDDNAGFRKVNCSSMVCGDSTSTIYKLTVRRENIDSINPDQNPLTGCVCGDTVTVFIGDEDGDTAKQRDATILEYFRPNAVNPNPILMVKLASSLSAGECIQSIGCKDATPTYGIVVHCNDNSDDDTIEADNLRVVLDSPVPLNVGGVAYLRYYDVDGVYITSSSIPVTIVSMNPDTMTYELDRTTGATLTCNEEPTAVTVRLSSVDS